MSDDDQVEPDPHALRRRMRRVKHGELRDLRGRIRFVRGVIPRAMDSGGLAWLKDEEARLGELVRKKREELHILPRPLPKWVIKLICKVGLHLDPDEEDDFTPPGHPS